MNGLGQHHAAKESAVLDKLEKKSLEIGKQNSNKWSRGSFTLCKTQKAGLFLDKKGSLNLLQIQ
eukprot:9064042-Prorocentrum_lima.AAC.1